MMQKLQYRKFPPTLRAKMSLGRQFLSGSVLHRSISQRSVAGPRATVAKKVFATGLPRHLSSKAPPGPSSPNIVQSPLGEIAIPSIPFHELIFQNLSLWEKKTAIACASTGRKYTYKELYRYSRALAASIQNKLKLSKGDFMAVILPNCPEYPVVMLASSLTGVILTTVNPAYTTHEIQAQLVKCGVKAIITADDFFPKCVQSLKEMKAEIPVIVIRSSSGAEIPEGGIDYLEMVDPARVGDLKSVPIAAEDPLVVPFSSGTTGSPKGAVLSHGNLVSNLTQISHPETLLMTPTTWMRQDTIMAVLPMFHIYGLVIVTFYSLKDGCRVIALPRFDPRLYIMNIVRKKATILYVVPQLLQFFAHPKVKGRYLRKVKYMINAASPMDMSAAYKILEKAPNVKIGQGYGMTESSPTLTHSNTKRMQKLLAVGVPVASTRLKVVNLETGEPQPWGKEGELCAWGPQVMKGYLDSPDATDQAFDKDGWLRTGDIAYYDQEGDFFIVDRLKSLIKVKGFQVAPAELESAIGAHPKVKEVAVVGIKSPDFGEIPRAYVVLHKDEKMTEDEVKEIISRKMSDFKHLRGGVKFVEELPRNSTGKVVRRKLTDLDR